MIRETRLADPDTWKNVFNNAPMSERKYVREIHEMLLDMASQSKSNCPKNAFVYNFRTGTCIYYDLTLEKVQPSLKKGKDSEH